jgi:hypothetical protein
VSEPTIADLMAEIQALKREVAQLRAAPAMQRVDHYHHQAGPLDRYYQPAWVPNSPVPGGGTTCGTVTAAPGVMRN